LTTHLLAFSMALMMEDSSKAGMSSLSTKLLQYKIAGRVLGLVFSKGNFIKF